MNLDFNFRINLLHSKIFMCYLKFYRINSHQKIHESMNLKHMILKEIKNYVLNANILIIFQETARRIYCLRENNYI